MGRRVGNWELEPVPIGSGSFAIVWKARHLDSGVLGAVKEINTDKLSPKLHESLQSEIAVLRQTRHRNIVGMLDLIEEPGKMFLVLEFCSGGDLGQYLRQYRCVSEHAARYLMLQLSAGLRELHELNVLHRDLKPQNLLLSDTSQQPILKIADFGFARNLHPQGMAETLCGSPLYMAPEILQSHKYDTKADLWSVGTILHEMLTGRPPFTGTNHIQLLHNIQRLEPRLSDSLPHHLSPHCRALLLQLLRHQPQHRIGFQDFFTHPFLQQAEGEEGGGEASMTATPPRQQRRQHEPRAGAWDEAAAVAAPETEPEPARAPGSPRPRPHPHGGHKGGKAHPLEPSRSDSDCEYVVVSGASSPLMSSEAGSGAGGRHHHHHGHRGHRAHAAPAMASMATAWAAAAAQAMANVARSVQHSHSPPSATKRQHKQEQGRGTFYCPQLFSSQQLPSAEPAAAAAPEAPGPEPDRPPLPPARAAAGSEAPAVPGAGPSEQQECSRPGAAEAHAGRPGPAAAAAAGAVDLGLLAHQIRLPEHLDPGDLLQRVILLLTESVRGRIAAAEAAELAAEEAAAAVAVAGPEEGGEEARRRARRAQAQAAAGALPGQLLALYLYAGRLLEAGLAAALGTGRGAGTASEESKMGAAAAAAAAASKAADSCMPAGNVGSVEMRSGTTEAVTAVDRAAKVSVKNEAAAATAATAATACPGEGIEATAATGMPAGMKGGVMAAEACLGSAPVCRRAGGENEGEGEGEGGLHRPSPAPDLRLLLPLKQLAKALVACADGRTLRELRSQVACDDGGGDGGGGGGCDVPAPAHAVLDSALRYGRAAAADELLGLLPLGVEGYARAADLLLFLLTSSSLPGSEPGPGSGSGSGTWLLPEELQPRLGPQDRQRVYTAYAAVKLRQVSCMAALNAQQQHRSVP